MSESFHTPGPWFALEVQSPNYPGQYQIATRRANPETVALIIPAPTSKGDAKLIAAAPGLLAACRAALREFEAVRQVSSMLSPEIAALNDPEIIEVLRTAISKVELEPISAA